MKNWLGNWWLRQWQSVQALRHSAALRWLGPALHHPRLWHMSRRGIALGAAIGGFVGVLVPLGQMPVAALLAVGLRANLPTAVLATFITNPFTFGMVYWLAYKVGSVLGIGDQAALAAAWREDAMASLATVVQVAKPLAAGLGMLAILYGLLSYLAVHWLWRFKVSRALRRRRQRRG